MLPQGRLFTAADWLAAGILFSLPWSTSATSFLILLWLLVVVPTLRQHHLTARLTGPAAFLPAALWVLAVLGLFWSQVTWPEKLEGLRAFHKLLLIPLLMIHFSRSQNALKVLSAFLVSSLLLLIYSWASLAWPGLALDGRVPGVPIKDHIYQGICLVISACVFLHFAITSWQRKKNAYALACTVVIALLLANLAYIGTSRTALIVLMPLSLLIGYQRFGWRGAGMLMAAVLLFGAIAWSTSPYFRARMTELVHGTVDYQPTENTSEAQRIEFWRKSLALMRDAPVMGHGTGSIRPAFEKMQEGTRGASAVVVSNPHNQTFAVGIQFGFIGIAILWLMWLFHLLLFRGTGLVAWLGSMVVVQNVVASTFNSHLSDFTAGWLYVMAVGILGGMVLRQRSPVRS